MIGRCETIRSGSHPRRPTSRARLQFAPGVLDSDLKGPNQGCFLKRLFQEGHRTSIKWAVGSGVRGERRDKDDGGAMTFGEQAILQFEPVEAWHLQVGNQA